MIDEIILILFGLGVLLVSGDILVRGAVGLATALKVPALLVSLTIVAFGTSAPELVVSIQAVLQGSGGIAIGNIIGSNIANIFLVLGFPALVYPIATQISGLTRHVVVMLIASAAFAGVAYTGGVITPAIGYALFAGIIAYVSYMGLRAARGADDDPLIDDVAEYAGAGLSARTILFLIVGLIGLPLGAHLLVTNGSTLAAAVGVREAVIGLTIVAFGTSLPELATVLAAAFHKKSDVAIGNVVGSNIFNILAVGGATGIAGGAAFDPLSRTFDLPIMLASALVIAAFVFARRSIGRVWGAVLAALYLGFVILLSAQAI